MAIEFVDLDAARRAEGLCLVLLKGVPSPWSQATKALVEIKGIDALGLWMPASDPDITAWTGMPNAPVVRYAGEPPRAHWADILALVERLGPEPALVPADIEQRMRMFGYANELMGQAGLIWNVRLMAVDAALSGGGEQTYPEPVARYLGGRYGHTPGCGQAARARAMSILSALSAQLQRGLDAGGPYYFGAELTALDIYATTVMDSLVVLPEAQCPMHPRIRAGLEGRLPELGDAVCPTLIAHRDMMHDRHMPLPISMG